MRGLELYIAYLCYCGILTTAVVRTVRCLHDGEYVTTQTACDETVRKVWEAYEVHEKRVKKESKSPQLRAATKKLQTLSEKSHDANCWEQDATLWDTAVDYYRRQLEDSARGATTWDDATRVNHGDNAAISRLLDGPRSPRSATGFASMLIYDARVKR